MRLRDASCAKCHAALPDGAGFCEQCGEPVPKPVSGEGRCGACGEALAEGARFCEGCGAAVSGDSGPTPADTCPDCGRGDQVIPASLVGSDDDLDVTSLPEPACRMDPASLGTLASEVAPSPVPPSPSAIVPWFFVPFVPLANVLLPWFAPIAGKLKLLIAFLLVGGVAGMFMVQGFTADHGGFISSSVEDELPSIAGFTPLDLPWILYFSYVLVFSVGLVLRRRAERVALRDEVIPGWHRARAGWPHLRYCDRCRCAYLVDPEDGSKMSAPLAEAHDLLWKRS